MTTPQLKRERFYLNLAAALACAATLWLFLCPDLRRALCGCARWWRGRSSTAPSFLVGA